MWRLKVSWVPTATRRTTHSTPHCCVSLSCQFSPYPSPSQACFPPFLSSPPFLFFHVLPLPYYWFAKKYLDSFLYFHQCAFFFFPFWAFNTKQLLKGKKKGRFYWNVSFFFFFSFFFFYSLSTSPWWLHCLPLMWNGIPAGSLQESGLLYWEHWNWCCHKLDHEPYGRPRWNWRNTLECNRDIRDVKKPPLDSLLASLCVLVQISQPRWCCRAAVLVPGPLQQRAFLRNTWRLSSPWASVETRQPKHFGPRLESKRSFNGCSGD